MIKFVVWGRMGVRAGSEAADSVLNAVKASVRGNDRITHCVAYIALEKNLPTELDTDGGEIGSDADADADDFALEVWTTDDCGDQDIAELAGSCAFYRVAESVEKGERLYPSGLIPGVTLLSRNIAKPGLSPAEAQAGYDAHPKTALPVQTGMNRYVRNTVIDSTPVSKPPIHSVSILNFPTDHDLTYRLFDGPGGLSAIIEDVSKFLDINHIQMFHARARAVK